MVLESALTASGDAGCGEQGDEQDSDRHAGLLTLNMAGTHRTRSDPAWVTAFEDSWPAVSRRVGAFLRKRGVPNADIEDLVQELACRLLQRQVAFTDTDDLLAWCVVVARHLSIDRVRRQARQAEAPVSDVASGPDMADLVDDRLRLIRTFHALQMLPLPDRVLVLAGFGDAPIAEGGGAARVRRHRLRRWLAETVAAVLAVLIAGLRRLERVLGRLPVDSTATAAFAMVVTVSVVGLVGTSPGPGQVGQQVRSAATLIGHAARATSPGGALTAALRTTAFTKVPHGSIGNRGFAATVPKPGSRGFVIATPDRAHTATVSNHDPGPGNDGVVCLDDFPVIAHLCLGPKQ